MGKALGSHAAALARQVVAVANQSFVHAMSNTLLIAAGISLLGALVALVFLPSRPHAEVTRSLATKYGTWVRTDRQWVLLREEPALAEEVAA
jgi:hypothetical protein